MSLGLPMTLSELRTGHSPQRRWEHAPCVRAVKPTFTVGNGWPEHAEPVPGGCMPHDANTNTALQDTTTLRSTSGLDLP